MNTIPIVEIFGNTVQGEGPNVGARCIFVRVKGCSFNCSWCDSKFTWNSDSYPAIKYSSQELIDKLNTMVSETNCNRIVLTGGNPCLYDFTEVIHSLRSKVSFDVETQGDLLPEWLDLVETIVFSPKAPSSGMKDTYDQITTYLRTRFDGSQQVAIKIPVFTDEDVEFARRYSRLLNEYLDTGIYQLRMYLNNNLRMYLSVGNSDVDDPGQIRDRVLSDYESLLNRINESPKDFENVYILPQVHTLVWGNKQGV